MRTTRRITVLSTALWTLLGLPILCTGGLLEHACECRTDPGADCCPSDVAGCCPSDETGCGHEEGCDTDPCEIVAVKPSRGFASAHSGARMFDQVHFVGCRDRVVLASDALQGARRLAPPGSRRLPLFESALPLLL